LSNLKLFDIWLVHSPWGK